MFNLGTSANNNLQFVLILQSSHSVVFLKIAVLKNFKRFIIKICLSLFFNNVAGFRTATLLKRYSCTGVSCQFWEIFQRSYSLEHVQKVASGSPKWIMQVIKLTLKKKKKKKKKNAWVLDSYFTIPLPQWNLIQKHKLIWDVSFTQWNFLTFGAC